MKVIGWTRSVLPSSSGHSGALRHSRRASQRTRSSCSKARRAHVAAPDPELGTVQDTGNVPTEQSFDGAVMVLQELKLGNDICTLQDEHKAASQPGRCLEARPSKKRLRNLSFGSSFVLRYVPDAGEDEVAENHVYKKCKKDSAQVAHMGSKDSEEIREYGGQDCHKPVEIFEQKTKDFDGPSPDAALVDSMLVGIFGERNQKAVTDTLRGLVGKMDNEILMTSIHARVQSLVRSVKTKGSTSSLPSGTRVEVESLPILEWFEDCAARAIAFMAASKQRDAITHCAEQDMPGTCCIQALSGVAPRAATAA